MINSMHNAGDGAAGDKVMAEVGVHPRGGDDGITQRWWSVVRCFFVDIVMGCRIPVVSLRRQLGAVGTRCAVTEGRVFELEEKADNAADTLEADP